MALEEIQNKTSYLTINSGTRGICPPI